MSRPSRARTKILVVDDDASTRELVKLHLANNGYDVVLAEDAVVAGYLVLREPPDLILLDVHMPFMTGYEFAAALKADELTRDIPVIFLTTDTGVAEHARTLGASGYLNKPVTADRLVGTIDLFATH